MSSDLQARLQAALGDAYRLERELTRGGMSRLFLATEASLNRQVVVKVLPPDIVSQVSTERFRQEIELAAHLQHPNILPVLAAGTRDNLLYYVVPYVPGESLRHRLTREGRLPVSDAIRILHEVADALAYAHAEGIIHRDIKPENILLEGSHAVLTDFGVARALGQARSGDRLTDTGLAVGTPGYMAPEQAAGDRQIDGRADVYALAVVGYEMLAGFPPFAGASPQALVAAHITDIPRPLVDARPEVPPAVAGALSRALAKDPNARLRTAAQLRDALGPAQADVRARHLSRRVIVGLGTAAVLLLIGATALVLRRSSPATLESNLLAVAPFDVLDPKLELWREGLVDLLARNLDGAGPLRTVPPTTVIRRWNGRADQVTARELGRRTGARLTVFGSLVPTGGDSVRLRATLFDATADRSLADLELRDATARIDRLSDSLTVRLLAELGRNRRIELTRVASLGSTSLPALKAFLQGEQWFRRTAWDSALASYERAVELDSNFCLAVWRLSRVYGWQRVGFDSLANALATRAGELNHGLAPRDSLLVAVDSLLQINVPQTRNWYRVIKGTAQEAVRRYPDDADAWNTLGEVFVHGGIEFGATPEEALAAFDRAIALDSAYAPAYIHAIELATQVHGVEAGKRYAAQYLRRAPDDVSAAGIRLALDLIDPARSNLPETQRAIEKASGNVLFKAYLPFFWGTDSGEAAVRAARALAVADDVPWLPSAFRRGVLTAILTYRGHLREASVTWDSTVSGAAPFRTILSLLGAGPPEVAKAYFRDRLRVGDHGGASSGLTLWAREGDFASIAQYRRLTDSVVKSSTDPPQREKRAYWSAAAQAYLALARRDSAEALRRFTALPDSLCDGCYFERLNLLLLRSAFRQDRKVVDSRGPWSGFPTAREVIGRMEQARAADRLGEDKRAVRGYRFVAEVWQHADPELQPYVTEARQGLARLTSEP